jgi:hypothetical protein
MSLTQLVQPYFVIAFVPFFSSFRVLPQPSMTGYDREDDEMNNKPKRNEVSPCLFIYFLSIQTNFIF